MHILTNNGSTYKDSNEMRKYLTTNNNHYYHIRRTYKFTIE